MWKRSELYSGEGRGLICLQNGGQVPRNITKGFQLNQVVSQAQLQQDYRKWRLVRGGNITRVNLINFIDQ